MIRTPPATTLDRFEFTIPFAVASKKNSQVIIQNPHSKRAMLVASAKARRHEADVRALALAEMARLGIGDATVFGDASVEVDIAYDTDRETIHVVIRKVCDRPKGRSGRQRDTYGIADGILDALQKLVYHNDNQVARITVTRLVRGDVA